MAAETQERTAGDLVVKTFPPAFGGRLIVEIQTTDGASIAEIDTLHSTKADKAVAAEIVKRFNRYPLALSGLEKAKEGLKAALLHIHDPLSRGPVVDALNEARAVLTDLEDSTSI